MGVIDIADIFGYEIDGRIICTEHITEEQLKEVTENQIITIHDIDEEKIYFCDEGKEKM